MEIALPPVRTVTVLLGRVIESTRPDHRKRQRVMPRTDADDPSEYIFPSRCYALAGLQLHLSVRRSPHVASALKPASATSLMYSASSRGENRPRKAAGCVCRGLGQAESDALAWLRRAAAARDRVRLAYSVRPDGTERVEYAIKFPADGDQVLLAYRLQVSSRGAAAGFRCRARAAIRRERDRLHSNRLKRLI
jgi:hypothetical protein